MTDQAPGFYRMAVGEHVVTAVNDGVFDQPLAMLNDIAPEDASAMLTAAFRRPTPRLSINSFVVQSGVAQSGGRTVLIDTGAGTLMGPMAGRLLATLAAAGIQPDQVDLVLMTHLHPDHTAGLATADGRAVFPNASLACAAAEAAFWLDQDADAAPEGMRPYVQSAQAATRPYRERMTRLGTQPAAPGITPVPLPGHTPGHVGYRVGDGAESLLIWGDVVHVPDVQIARPEIGVGFDADPAAAIATRTRVLDMAATDRLAVAGMHVHFPAFSHVVRDGSGYRLVPEAWVPFV